MDDGTVVPSGHDGMAIVEEGPGVCVLIRNHEIGGTGTPIAPSFNYDSIGPGGTTAIQVRGG